MKLINTCFIKKNVPPPEVRPDPAETDSDDEQQVQPEQESSEPEVTKHPPSAKKPKI